MHPVPIALVNDGSQETRTLQQVIDSFDATDEGELVDLVAEGPAAAARIDIDEAESAVLYVSAPVATAAQARAIAHLLGQP